MITSLDGYCMYRPEQLKSPVSIYVCIKFTNWLCLSVALKTAALGYLGVESDRIMIVMDPGGDSRVVNKCTAGSSCCSNEVNAESQELRCS